MREILRALITLALVVGGVMLLVAAGAMQVMRTDDSLTLAVFALGATLWLGGLAWGVLTASRPLPPEPPRRPRHDRST